MAAHQDAHPLSDNAVVRTYERLLEAVGVIGLATIVVVMSTQVFARYVIGTSIIWAEELCRYILIWISFLFVGIAFQRGEFIAIDYVTQILPRVWRFALKVVVSVPMVGFLGLMVANGYAYASRMQAQTLPAIDFIARSLGLGSPGVSIFWVYISVVLGCALLIAHITISLIAEALALRAGASDHQNPAG